MGRLEHNDNIDDRIIKEIKESDIVIADLTYGRQRLATSGEGRGQEIGNQE